MRQMGMMTDNETDGDDDETMSQMGMMTDEKNGEITDNETDGDEYGQ
jgi:hypothetical protein